MRSNSPAYVDQPKRLDRRSIRDMSKTSYTTLEKVPEVEGLGADDQFGVTL
jgi:hypothetical protein